MTGGIGAGKSTVARRLVERGAVLVDADVLAREVLAPGSDGLAEVVATFGAEVLAADGSLDRGALGTVVFGDAGARGRLEAITHPRIRELTAERFAAAPEHAVVVHDVPLLVELAYEDRYHLTVVVHTDAEERVRRLVTERGSTVEDARRRVAAQADDDARRRAADVWLDNSGAPHDLLEAADRLWEERVVPFEVGVRTRTAAERPPELVLTPADPAWEATGARLAARVARAAGGLAVRVDHIGSTSVPGLVAKDVIDLQLVVADLGDADALEDPLGAAGLPRRAGAWGDTPKPDTGPVGGETPGRDVGSPGSGTAVAGAGHGSPARSGAAASWEKRLHGSADPGRAVNLHVRAAGSPGARYALLFRDWLRAEAGEREAYAALKQRLAGEHGARAGYAEAKEPWFTEVAWPRMQEWATRTGWVSPV